MLQHQNTRNSAEGPQALAICCSFASVAALMTAGSVAALFVRKSDQVLAHGSGIILACSGAVAASSRRSCYAT
jgi:hypothetical protein